MTERPAVLTVTQAAKYLNISPSTIYGWRAGGKGPRAVKVGRNVYFKVTDLDAWLDAHLEEVASGTTSAR